MRTLLRILTYLRPHRKRLAVTYICIAVVTVLNLLIPWVIKQVIDVGLASGSQRYMVQAALVVVAIAAARMIFSFGQRFGMESSGQMVSYDVRNQVYDHIQRLSFSYHTHAQTGQLMSRMAEDVGAIQRFVSGALLDSLSIILMLGFIIIILLQLSWQLALDQPVADADPGISRQGTGRPDAAQMAPGAAGLRTGHDGASGKPDGSSSGASLSARTI